MFDMSWLGTVGSPRSQDQLPTVIGLQRQRSSNHRLPKKNAAESWAKNSEMCSNKNPVFF